MCSHIRGIVFAYVCNSMANKERNALVAVLGLAYLCVISLPVCGLLLLEANFRVMFS